MIEKRFKGEFNQIKTDLKRIKDHQKKRDNISDVKMGDLSGAEGLSSAREGNEHEETKVHRFRQPTQEEQKTSLVASKEDVPDTH